MNALAERIAIRIARCLSETPELIQVLTVLIVFIYEKSVAILWVFRALNHLGHAGQDRHIRLVCCGTHRIP